MGDMSLYEGDCHAELSKLVDDSVDLILIDPPYGNTSAVWDKALRWKELWPELWRVLRPNGVVLIHSVMPATVDIIQSQRKYFRYTWTWQRSRPCNFLNAKKQPMRVCEDILVFYKAPPPKSTYNPQMWGEGRRQKPPTTKMERYNANNIERKEYESRYPVNIIDIPSPGLQSPHMKPPQLVDYFLRTYTNEGDVVLDPSMHKGLVGLRCQELNRKFIGIERHPDFFAEASSRLSGLCSAESA